MDVCKKCGKRHEPNPHTEGLRLLRRLQRKLGKPPKKTLVPKLVKKLIRLSGITGSSAQYFRLQATSALLNKEPRLRDWKKTKRGA